MESIPINLKKYIEVNIIPMYVHFDDGHNIEHVNFVIERSLRIASQFNVDFSMVYTIAAYHDVGLRQGRENHGLNSGGYLKNDLNLKNWFSAKEIVIMQEAVEDHRASNDNIPRSIYGKIVADADRNLNLQDIIFRSYKYVTKKYPTYKFEQIFNNVYKHITDKYGSEGYMKLWLNDPVDQKQLQLIRNGLKNKNKIKNLCKTINNNKRI